MCLIPFTSIVNTICNVFASVTTVMYLSFALIPLSISVEENNNSVCTYMFELMMCCFIFCLFTCSWSSGFRLYSADVSECAC